MLKPLTKSDSVQKVSMICRVLNVIDNNFLFEEIWIIWVCLNRFLSDSASAMSFVVRGCSLFLCMVCWIPLMHAMTVLVVFVAFFQGGLSGVIGDYASVWACGLGPSGRVLLKWYWWMFLPLLNLWLVVVVGAGDCAAGRPAPAWAVFGSLVVLGVGGGMGYSGGSAWNRGAGVGAAPCLFLCALWGHTPAVLYLEFLFSLVVSQLFCKLKFGFCLEQEVCTMCEGLVESLILRDRGILQLDWVIAWKELRFLRSKPAVFSVWVRLWNGRVLKGV